MKLAIGTIIMLLCFAEVAKAQSNDKANSARQVAAPVSESATGDYLVRDATPSQEAALRTQISLIRPDVLPLRVFFLPHSKYLDTARIFQLHVPKGYGSLMFTHLPSRTVFIDNNRYQGEDWLGYWIAHELGHLAANSAIEQDAEKAAHEFRKRLEYARKQSALK